MRIVRLLLSLACLGVFLVVGAGAVLPAGAQTTAANEWTWVGGAQATTCSPQTCDQNPVYGTFGVLAAGNDPGSGGGDTWTDSRGNFWLFGNVLWEFNPTTKEWGWMAPSNYFDCGSTCLDGQYGTLGVPGAGNLPGFPLSATTWTDKSGNLWLFGGSGGDYAGTLGFLNDLWEFTPSNGEWEWVSGRNYLTCVEQNADCGVPGVYGTLGTPAPGNTPGSRTGSMGWLDNSGRLWLFGGQGNDSNPITSTNEDGSLNDFWEFDPATTEWTWMGGSNSFGPNYFEPGVYGTLGVPSTGNIPSSRTGGATWVDSSGHFWLFGGEANLVGSPNSIYAGEYVGGSPNDLWEFDPSTLEWTWQGGNDVTVAGLVWGSPPGVYGTLGVPAPGNIPGGRTPAAHWTDKAGNFWLFGGASYDAAGNYGYLNDLWEFNPSTKLWAWMGGSNTIPCLYNQSGNDCAPQGVYGTLGNPAVGNVPGGRSSAQSWTDADGNFWLRSGETYNWNIPADGPNDPPGEPAGGTQGLDDLWEYHPSTTSLPPAATPVLSLPSGDYQTSQTLTISNGMTDANIYYTVDGSTPTSGSTLYSGPITISSTETVRAIAIATGYPASGLASATYAFKTYSPTFSEPAGTYNYPISVTITDAISSAPIYYTTDGSTPTSSSAQYSMPLTISTSETIKAIAVYNGYSSDVVSATYTMELAPAAATPSFSVAGGTYASSQSVTISDATAGATIYYTTDGTTSTTSSSSWTESFTLVVSSTETIEALAAASGYSTSAVATATYTIPQSFSLSMNPTSMTVTAGVSGSTTVTVQDEGGFNGNVSFACSGLPAGAGCSFTTLTVPTAAGVSYTTLTVTTSSTTAEVRRGAGALLPGAAMAVVVCCFGLRKRRRLLMLVLFGVSAVGLGVLGGCGSGGSGGGGGGGGTQPVTSTVTVTATSGTLTQTATFTLTVN